MFLRFTEVCRSGIRLGWLMYFIIHPNGVMSGKCINTCTAGYSNCRCCTDTHLIFSVISCMPQALSEILLQILRLGLYFLSNALVGVWFFNNTRPPTLKSVCYGSLIGGGHLSLAILRFTTAIIYEFCILHHPYI